MTGRLALGSAMLVAMTACSTIELAPPTEAMVTALQAGGSDRCTRTTASVMDSLGVTADEIDEVEVGQRVNGNDDRQMLQGYTVWTSLQDWQGYIVTYTRPNCRFLSVFSRGDIDIQDGRLVR